MAGSESLVRVDRDGAVVTLTLHDPRRRNAMSRVMGETFAARLGELSADPSLRAVVLTGAGGAFSAGGDLAMLEGHAREARAGPEAEPGIRDAMRDFYALFLGLRDLPCPSIAAIDGPAIGAGLCLALACDLRIAARGARLALNFARLGLHPGMGATWILPRLVGPARAAELLYSGRSLDAEEAAAMGLVNRCTAPHAALAEARELAAQIAAGGPIAVRGTRRALALSAGHDLPEQLDLEAREQARCFATRDVEEGLRAAREGRPPDFRGR